MSGRPGRRLLASLTTRFGWMLGGMERGATATEYAILVSFIALVVVISIAFFGGNLSTYYNDIATTVAGFL